MTEGDLEASPLLRSRAAAVCPEGVGELCSLLFSGDRFLHEKLDEQHTVESDPDTTRPG